MAKTKKLRPTHPGELPPPASLWEAGGEDDALCHCRGRDAISRCSLSADIKFVVKSH